MDTLVAFRLLGVILALIGTLTTFVADDSFKGLVVVAAGLVFVQASRA